MSWTNERVAELVKLHNEGLSFSQIATSLGGFSHTADKGRSACIGKAHRLGLIARPHKPQPRVKVVRETIPHAVRRLEAKRAQALDEALTPEPLPAPEIITTAYFCTLAALENTSCRWPCWQDGAAPEQQFFCGTPTADVYSGRPYCGGHSRIAFGGKPERKPRPYWVSAGRAA